VKAEAILASGDRHFGARRPIDAPPDLAVANFEGFDPAAGRRFLAVDGELVLGVLVIDDERRSELRDQPRGVA